MAESRGGKEDKRLKASYSKLWEEGTDYIFQERFHIALTSKQLNENKILDRPLSPLALNEKL